MPNNSGGSGGCLCGGVRYRVVRDLRDVIVCHCSQCRKTTGYFGAFSACSNDDLVMENDQTLAWYESSPGVMRGFCRACGSTLFWDDASRSHVAVAAGSLDEPTGLKLTGHVYAVDKGDYYQIDERPGAEIHPGSMDGVIRDPA